MDHALQGIYPVLPTPFDSNEEIVLSDMKNMIDFAVKSGVQGITINEFFSEFYLFTDKERKEVVETICKYAEGKIPVIVGVCATTPMLATYWAEHAQANGAAAVICSAPYLHAYPWDDLVDRGFRIMNEKLNIPIILQNAVDDVMAANLSAEIGRGDAKFLMEEFEHIQYYKDDANGIQIAITKFFDTIKDLPEGACKGLFTGAVNGSDMHSDFLRGATGFMPPLHMADYREKQWQHLKAGETDESFKMQNELSPLLVFERLFQLDVCMDVLKRRGVIENINHRRSNTTVFNSITQNEFGRIYNYLSERKFV